MEEREGQRHYHRKHIRDLVEEGLGVGCVNNGIQNIKRRQRRLFSIQVKLMLINQLH